MCPQARIMSAAPSFAQPTSFAEGKNHSLNREAIQ